MAMGGSNTGPPAVGVEKWIERLSGVWRRCHGNGCTSDTQHQVAIVINTGAITFCPRVVTGAALLCRVLNFPLANEEVEESKC